ncbi:PREDICTED: calcium-binding protein 7 [Tinamus guttatus]|uniref:calcium-binding protein 7 n=1 Tax=Tinamus guttatus TaxID=94827 RepID=UPI00052ED183|nr:PREDICTED: calcium-binding protein 7 [Tinamus guttatus]
MAALVHAAAPVSGCAGSLLRVRVRVTPYRTVHVRASASVSSGSAPLLPAEIREAFKVFDRDGNGFISKQELGTAMRSLGYMPNEVELEVIIQRLDMDGDGQVDFEEFVTLLGPKLSTSGIPEKFHGTDFDTVFWKVGETQAPCGGPRGTLGPVGQALGWCGSRAWMGATGSVREPRAGWKQEPESQDQCGGPGASGTVLGLMWEPWEQCRGPGLDGSPRAIAGAQDYIGT